VLNSYYFAAIICAALAAYFSYMGATTDSKSDNTKIEGELKALGNKIETLSSGKEAHQVTASELSRIQGEYNAIAESFYKDFPLEIEQQRSRNASKTINQLEQSRHIEPHLHTLELAAKQLADAFNKHRAAPPISVETPTFPTNVFEGDGYHMVLSFPNSRYWVIELIKNSNEELKLTIGQATKEPRNNKEPFWNIGRSIFLIFSEGESSFRLFIDLPAEMKVRILGGLDKNSYAIGELDGIAKSLLEKIFKYEALEESLKS
jgi:hypothetical protein